MKKTLSFREKELSRMVFCSGLTVLIQALEVPIKTCGGENVPPSADAAVKAGVL